MGTSAPRSCLPRSFVCLRNTTGSWPPCLPSGFLWPPASHGTEVGGAAGRKRHAGAGPPVPPSSSHLAAAPPLRPRPEMRSERDARAGRLGPASGGLWRWLRQRVRGSGNERVGVLGVGASGDPGSGPGGTDRGASRGRQRLAGAGEGGGPWFSGPISPRGFRAICQVTVTFSLPYFLALWGLATA